MSEHPADPPPRKRRPPVRAPAPVDCVLCGGARAHRRGSCWACYRKLREAGLPLPLPRSEAGRDPLLAWLTLLAPGQLAALLLATTELLALRPDAAGGDR